MIFRPTYVDKIMAYTDTPFVKILSGVRRCGKSTILKMVAEKLHERGVSADCILTYSFDSLQYEDMTAKMLYDEVKKNLPPDKKAYMFLDEVQEIQVTEKIERQKTEKREYDRLLGIKDNYPKYVLRTDEFSGGNDRGIRSMHIADFLLSGEY